MSEEALQAAAQQAAQQAAQRAQEEQHPGRGGGMYL
jgi:hypothetical protein